MNVATCPLCDTNLPIPRNSSVGSMLFCPRCDCLLQVVTLDPPEVDFPYKLSAGGDEPKLGRRSRRGKPKA
ncbi:MAG: hypothetical protein WAZ19_05510 [Anaerolineae bacterium]